MNQPNAVSDAPRPWPGLLAGSLQLAAWLVFQPSAWVRHVRSLDASLAPDFCLLELQHSQWRNPALRRLLLQMCLVLPLLILGLSLPLYHLVSLLRQSPTLDQWIILGYVLSGSLVMSAGISLPAGLAFSAVMAFGTICMSPQQANLTGVLAAAAGLSAVVQISLARRPGLNPARMAGTAISLVLPTAILLAALLLITALVQPASMGVGLEPGLVLSAAAGIALLVTVFAAATYHQRVHAWRRGLMFFSLALGLGTGAALLAGLTSPNNDWRLYLSAGLGGGLLFPFIFALGYYAAMRVGGAWSASLMGAFAGGLGWMPLAPVIFYPPVAVMPSMYRALLVLLAALTVQFWGPLAAYLPGLLWSNFLYLVDQNRAGSPRGLRLHPAFWYEGQILPWAGLDGHLVLLAERDPALARQVFQWLAVRRQAWAVRSAQIELAARQIGQCRDLTAIAAVQQTLAEGFLPGPATPIIQQFSEISQDVQAALLQTSELHSRTLLGEVRSRLHRLNNDLMISSLRPARRFVPIAAHWLRIVTHHLDQAALAVRMNESLPNPYICNTPLTSSQGVFVGRVEILNRIEQALLEPGFAPLMIYGQRRSGKTSLLLNLGRVLPSRIIPCYVDFQDSVSANDYTDLYYNLVQQLQRTALRQRGFELPGVDLALLAERPFLVFNDWLNAVETRLESVDKILLVKMDEIETLERVFQRPGLPPEVFFNSLRNTIQHRPRFRFIMAGSHTLAELRHWSNYLINSQLIKLGYLEPAEARQLIERPVPDFALRCQPQAVQAVLDLTRAHPYLVQMVCHELVNVKNSQPAAERYLASAGDVQAAAGRALQAGGFFFADLLNHLPADGEAMLHALARRGPGACLTAAAWQAEFGQDFQQNVSALLQKDLIEVTPAGYRFQVELVRRWMEQNGPRV